MVALAVPRTVAQQSQAFISSKEHSIAVDAKGVRHSGPTAPGKLAPWIEDEVKAVAPSYPYNERLHHHAGSGRFRLDLDLRTGSVTRITVVRSTGFQALDNSVIVAVRQWRWKPGRWKQIEFPVTFVLQRGPFRLPPGARVLPSV